MGTTCQGTDNTAPAEVLEALRTYINAEKKKPGSRFMNRQNVDDEGCCLLEDLGGEACSGDSCAYAAAHPATGRKERLRDYLSHKALGKRIPGLPVARAASARKRRPAPRKRPVRRKAKAGRRRR